MGTSGHVPEPRDMARRVAQLSGTKDERRMDLFICEASLERRMDHRERRMERERRMDLGGSEAPLCLGLDKSFSQRLQVTFGAQRRRSEGG